MRSKQRTTQLHKWHKWFAWKPVKVYDRIYQPLYWKWVWLETIYRRVNPSTGYYLLERVKSKNWQYHINPDMDTSEREAPYILGAETPAQGLIGSGGGGSGSAVPHPIAQATLQKMYQAQMQAQQQLNQKQSMLGQAVAKAVGQAMQQQDNNTP